MTTDGTQTTEEGLDPRSLLPPEVRLGGDVARAMAHLPDAPAAVAAHFRRFWDPSLRAALLRRLEAGEIVDDLVRAAAEDLRGGETDRGEVRPRPAG